MIDMVICQKDETRNYSKYFSRFIFDSETKEFIENIIYLFEENIRQNEKDKDRKIEDNEVDFRKMLELFEDKENKLYKDIEKCIYDYNYIGVLSDDIFKLKNCGNIDFDIYK